MWKSETNTMDSYEIAKKEANFLGHIEKGVWVLISDTFSDTDTDRKDGISWRLCKVFVHFGQYLRVSLEFIYRR